MDGQCQNIFFQVDLKRFKQDDINGLNVNTVRSDNLEGCVSVVDFEYPKTLHDLHNDHPFAPEKIE